MRLFLDGDDRAQVQLELTHVALELDAPVHDVAIAAVNVAESVLDLLNDEHALDLEREDGRDARQQLGERIADD